MRDISILFSVLQIEVKNCNAHLFKVTCLLYTFPPSVCICHQSDAPNYKILFGLNSFRKQETSFSQRRKLLEHKYWSSYQKTHRICCKLFYCLMMLNNPIRAMQFSFNISQYNLSSVIARQYIYMQFIRNTVNFQIHERKHA